MNKTRLFILINLIFLLSFFNAFATYNSDFSDNRGEYLIITHDLFYQKILPLAEWKHEKGVEVEIAKLSQIGSTSQEIKNYIQNAYNNWQIQPRYVLLVGDSETLPPYGSSDNYYSDMSGDLKSELFVGRLSVELQPISQIETVVSKILGYEQVYELENPDWMLSATTIIREDATGNQVYYDDIDYINSLMTANGFTKIDNFRSNWGDDKFDVQESVNEGKAFVTYRGSASANWYSPFNINPNDLENGFMLPIVMSATCYTGEFTSDGVLCETWLRAGSSNEPKGGVGVFATYTHGVGSHLTSMRSTITRAFYDAIFTQNKKTLGEVCVASKNVLLQQFPYEQEEYKGWNLMGDPELNIWKERPQEIEVSCLPVVPLGAYEYKVFVSDTTGQPLQGAKVAAVKDGDVYTTATSGTDGWAILNTNITSFGFMKITVTGEDLIPYQQDILVVNEISAIEGYVKNSENNSPLAHAKVFIQSINQFEYSDEDGFYRLYLPEGGDYQVETELFGFYDYQNMVSVAEGDTAFLDINLDPTPSGILQGQVTTEGNTPIPNALVKPLGVIVEPVSTNMSGYYIFPDIPGAHTYDIEVSHDNYESKMKTVTVPVNQATNLDFELTYLNTFEYNDGNFQPEYEWAWGVSQPVGGPENAHSGQKVWGVDLDGYYAPSTDQSLITPDYILAPGKDEYKLSFYHWYDANPGWDGGNVHISTDGGNNWEIIEPVGGYPDQSVVALQGQMGYTGESGWSNAQFLLDDYIGNSVKFRFRFASTNTNNRKGWFIDDFAVYGAYDPTTPVKEDKISVPDKFSLSQNYPNPFNPTTTISFELPTNGGNTRGVKLAIYDVSGKLIKTLIDNPIETGYHSVVWDGKDESGKEVNSGVYFYKLDATVKRHDPLISETKQMILLK